MAEFKIEVPDELIKKFSKLEGDTHKMFEEMVEAGAEVAENSLRANAPDYLKGNIKTTRVYNTPSDQAVNAKVIISGTITNRWGQTVSAGRLAMLIEYGTSGRFKKTTGAYTGYITKKPFFRKSFNKGKIEQAMLQAQEKYLKDLEE